MAGSLDFQFSLRVANGFFADLAAPAAQAIVQTNPGAYGGVSTVTTTPALIPNITPVTAAGWCYVQNLDPTYYILIGPTSGAMLLKLLPGESFAFRLTPGATPYAQAASGSSGSLLL